MAPAAATARRGQRGDRLIETAAQIGREGPGKGVFDAILAGEVVPLAPPARYVLAVVIFAAALAARFLLLPIDGGLAFLTFYPATMVAALLCGPLPGLLVMLLGATVAPYVFMAPHWSFAKFGYQHLLPTAVFVLSGLIVSFLAYQMRRRTDEARQANLRLREAMAALERREAELARSNQELDEFAYIASHDLKEPLRGLHNYASFIREDYAASLDEDGRNYLERMQRLVERMSALIDRLLAYSRLGTTEMVIEEVDLDRVLDEVAEDLGQFLQERGVTLVRATPLPRVRCNALRVGEALQNLIVNAAKYNDKADKRIEVGCDAQAFPPVFYVRDNGIGIAPQHRDAVFRIFKRLHEQEKYGGGTGAGLTIVKKIVERHGGRIWLESTPGEGTIFHFTLAGAAP